MRLPRSISALAVVGLTFGVPCLWSQNLGDIARQDRERRSRLSSHAPVLTNDDLARDRILTPELKNRILRTQAGTGAGVPQDAPAAPIAEDLLPPVTVEMIQQVRSAAVQPLAIEAVQPAARTETLAARTPAYIEPAVAVIAAPDKDEPVSPAEYQVRNAAVQPPAVDVIQPAVLQAEVLASRAPSYLEPAVEVIQPAAVTETLASRTPLYSEPAVAPTAAVNEPVSLGEYARRLRAYRAASVTAQPLDAGTAEPSIASHQQEVSLGAFARQLRAVRLAQLDLQTPEVAAAQTTVASEEEVSLGEYARQLQLRFSARALPVSAPAADGTAADAGQPVSLGEFARQLRAVRAVPAYESANITPLPPRVEAKALDSEISLGEYARQLRIRHSAEEYMQMLAQDDADIAAVLGQPTARLPYREIRPTPPAPSPRQDSVNLQVAPPKNNAQTVPQGQIAVTVRRGDSLWRLARLYLGSGARWQSIAFARTHRGSPDLIYAGEVVLIPVADPQRSYGMQLAKRFLGQRPR